MNFHPSVVETLLLFKALKVLGLPILGGGGWLARRWMLSSSMYWPGVEGHVQGYHPSNGECMVLLMYSYSVNGEYYSGEIPVQRSLQFRSEDAVRQQWPVNSAIDVRYSQKEPARSVGVLNSLRQPQGFTQFDQA